VTEVPVGTRQDALPAPPAVDPSGFHVGAPPLPFPLVRRAVATLGGAHQAIV
jgi:hypothetical protein